MVGNSQSEFTVKIHTFIPRNSQEKIPRKTKVISQGMSAENKVEQSSTVKEQAP